MSEDIDTIVKDSVEKVEEILAPKKFNLVDAIQGRSYPEDSVTVFLDQDAAYELTQVESEMKELASRTGRDDEALEAYNLLETEADTLRARIIDTSLTFTLRGIPQATYDSIIESVTKDEKIENKGHESNVRSIAKMLVRVTNSQGAVDEDREFSRDEVEGIYEAFGSHEWDYLNLTVNGLMFAATYFDSAVDAGFLSRR